MWLTVAAAACLGQVWAETGSGASRPKPDFHPFYLRSQFAGSQGLLSVGVGKAFLNGLIESDLNYGYVPEWVGGAGIHIVSQSNTLSLFPIAQGRSGTVYPLLLGFAAMVGQGDRYFIYGENYFNYYWPSALHFRAFTGVKYLQRREFIPQTSGLAGTLQIGIVDSDWMAAWTNESVNLGDIVRVALAVNLYLGSPSKK
jgi:hypothetical protein